MKQIKFKRKQRSNVVVKKELIEIIDENPKTELQAEEGRKVVKVKITTPSRSPYTKYVALTPDQIKELKKRVSTSLNDQDKTEQVEETEE